MANLPTFDPVNNAKIFNGTSQFMQMAPVNINLANGLVFATTFTPTAATPTSGETLCCLFQSNLASNGMYIARSGTTTQFNLNYINQLGVTQSVSLGNFTTGNTYQLLIQSSNTVASNYTTVYQNNITNSNIAQNTPISTIIANPISILPSQYLFSSNYNVTSNVTTQTYSLTIVPNVGTVIPKYTYNSIGCYYLNGIPSAYISAIVYTFSIYNRVLTTAEIANYFKYSNNLIPYTSTFYNPLPIKLSSFYQSVADFPMFLYFDADSLNQVQGYAPGSSIATWNNMGTEGVGAGAPVNARGAYVGTGGAGTGAYLPTLQQTGAVNNYRYYVQFNGTGASDAGPGNYFMLPPMQINFTGYTFFFVANVQSSGTSWDRIIDFSSNTTTSDNLSDNIIICRNTASQNLYLTVGNGVFTNAGSGTYAIISTSSQANLDSTWRIYGIRVTTNGYVHFFYNTGSGTKLIDTFTYSTAPTNRTYPCLNYTNSTIRTGCFIGRSNNNDSFSALKLGEFAMYRTALSDNAINAIIGVMEKRWNIDPYLKGNAATGSLEFEFNQNLPVLPITDNIGKILSSGTTLTSSSAAFATDPYYNYVTLLLHGIGGNNSQTFADSSQYNAPITPYGTYGSGAPVISTSPPANPNGPAFSSTIYFSSVGSSSVYSNFLLTPQSPNYTFGTKDFTIECWVYFASIPYGGTNYGILSNANASGANATWNLYYWTGPYWCFGTPAGQVQNTNIGTGQWYHLACTRYNNYFNMYVNGSSAYTRYQGTSTASFDTLASNFINIGEYSSTGCFSMNGYIADVRITIGVCRYTANFTPPTTIFPTIGKASISGTTTSIPTSPSMYNDPIRGYVMAFNSTTQYLNITSYNIAATSPNSYTKMFWINLSAAATSPFHLLSSTSTTASGVHYMMINNNGNIAAGHSSGTSMITNVYDPQVIVPGQWVHYVLVYENGASASSGYAQYTMILYRNGTAISQVTSSGMSWTGASAVSGVTIGGYGGTITGMNGYLDKIRIYGRALTVSEIQYIYNSEKLSLPTNPTSYKYYYLDNLTAATKTSLKGVFSLKALFVSSAAFPVVQVKNSTGQVSQVFYGNQTGTSLTTLPYGEGITIQNWTSTYGNGNPYVYIWYDQSQYVNGGIAYNATAYGSIITNYPYINVTTTPFSVDCSNGLNAANTYFTLPLGTVPVNSSYTFSFKVGTISTTNQGILAGGNYGNTSQGNAITSTANNTIYNYWWNNDFAITSGSAFSTPLILTFNCFPTSLGAPTVNNNISFTGGSTATQYTQYGYTNGSLLGSFVNHSGWQGVATGYDRLCMGLNNNSLGTQMYWGVISSHAVCTSDRSLIEGQ
jgi:Concanavalin A-like lectin/glucanases superfamily